MKKINIIHSREIGANRLNVENIQMIAEVLLVPVGYFFSKDQHKDKQEQAEKIDMVTDAVAPYLSLDDIKILQYLNQITDQRSREMIKEILRSSTDIFLRYEKKK